MVQINGKVRARLVVPPGTDAKGLTGIAKDDDKVQALVAGKTVVKVIAVPGQTDQSRRQIASDRFCGDVLYRTHLAMVLATTSVRNGTISRHLLYL